MFLPLNVMSSVSRLYRAPLHTSHGTYTSGRKCISILIVPSPAHASQRPPFTLNENRPGQVAADLRLLRSPRTATRILSKTPEYVAGFDRGVRPIGDWSMLMTLSRCSAPSTVLCRPGTTFDLYTRCMSAWYRMSLTSVLFPLPLTPVTATKHPSGNPTSRFCRLCSWASRTTSHASPGCAPALGDLDRPLPREVLAGDRALLPEHVARACPRRRSHRRAHRRPGRCRRRGRRPGSSPRRARPRSPCCRGRAGARACRSGAGCRAGAARSTARRGRRARRRARCRSATRAGCAAPRHRRASPTSG